MPLRAAPITLMCVTSPALLRKEGEVWLEDCRVIIASSDFFTHACNVCVHLGIENTKKGNVERGNVGFARRIVFLRV